MDEAIRSLIERDVLNGSGVEVVFDAPTKDWAARRNAPTVNVYLYDIREDVKRRHRGMINEYDDAHRVVARRPPGRHFTLSYLVTAWTQRTEDEHRLLSAVLTCFLRHEHLPRDLLSGALAEAPAPLAIGMPPPEDRSFTDVWSALGGELKPSLDLVITAPLDTARRFAVGPPVREEASIRVVDTTTGAFETPTFGGRRRRAATANPAPGATSDPASGPAPKKRAAPPRKPGRTS